MCLFFWHISWTFLSIHQRWPKICQSPAIFDQFMVLLYYALAIYPEHSHHLSTSRTISFVFLHLLFSRARLLLYPNHMDCCCYLFIKCAQNNWKIVIDLPVIDRRVDVKETCEIGLAYQQNRLPISFSFIVFFMSNLMDEHTHTAHPNKKRNPLISLKIDCRSVFVLLSKMLSLHNPFLGQAVASGFHISILPWPAQRLWRKRSRKITHN